MIEVHPRIFVGKTSDYQDTVAHQEGWATVHACKYPYHPEFVGYTGRAIGKDHPEYLWARRENRLVLNIIDVDNPAFFSKNMIDQALDFIDEHYATGSRVLIHCNQGESRGPSLAMLYLAVRAGVLSTTSMAEAEEHFQKCYPTYNPKEGIRGHIRSHWRQYCEEGGPS